MPRCELCGKPITTEEFDNNDGTCNNCSGELEAETVY